MSETSVRRCPLRAGHRKVFSCWENSIRGQARVLVSFSQAIASEISRYSGGSASQPVVLTGLWPRCAGVVGVCFLYFGAVVLGWRTLTTLWVLHWFVLPRLCPSPYCWLCICQSSASPSSRVMAFVNGSSRSRRLLPE